ncbi:DinB family protein [Glutamicibacter sp. MNS18]|uniref:DinB family protein n=1 Tax=Glutamicibacter sp. MNS18 TaxID=2989817 RepID=UPI002235B14D|nr:DinB family protein [Glutamicibacter sp. MNS18]MCW4466475.1 DinB family protein [Glutamicibacter sp. MNS18]
MSNDEASRKARLRRYLDSARDAVLWKAEGLGEAQLRRPLVPSGTSILGVINHLAFTEFGYFSYCMSRPVDNDRAARLFASEDPMADFVVEAGFSGAEVLRFYREAITASDAAFDELPLDAPAHVEWWGENGHTTLEHLMLHMCTETARHAGHLDLLRELLDGRTGMYRQNDNLPDYSPEQWQEHYDRVKDIADSV